MQKSVTLNHQTFLALLEGSSKAVWAVAYWLWNKGYEVRISPMTKAPTAADWKKHSDNGDLYVKLPSQFEWSRVEVKHRKVPFTCREDFKHTTMFVCSKHSYDRANPKPYAYVVVNNDMTHIAIIPTSTFSQWIEEEAADKNFGNGYRQMKYTCPTELIHFVPFTTQEKHNATL